MNTATQNTATDNTATEKERFWKEHAKRQRESGLSRVAYCRKYQLRYEQFSYWEQKWRQETTSSGLLPVSLNTSAKISDSLKAERLCTLAFKNGHELKIHDKSILMLLLSLWG